MHVIVRSAALLILFSIAAPALAHPGHAASGVLDGLLHPLTGIDHLLAIVAVGWWSAASKARRWWVVPLVFAVSMLGGALLGLGHGTLPYQERLIAASVVALGALMLTQARWPVAAMAALAGALALAHGYAHGSELPQGNAAPWLAGMVVATLTLHLGGAYAGQLSNRHARWATPAAGSLTLVAGLALLAGAIGA